MLELDLVDIDGTVSAADSVQPASMVEMQVAHYHRFNILDVVAGFGNCGGELVFL